MELNKAEQPLVSVIMPAYNVQQYIGSAIRSVMRQTCPDWELIVIDDGSSDTTVDVVEALASEDARIRLFINRENMGVSRTRNIGISLCRGTYIAFLDSDDLWEEEKLARQLELADSTGADLIYTSYGIIGQTGKNIRRDYLVPERVSYSGLLRENVIGCSTVLIRADIARNNLFFTDFYHEDYVLWVNLLRAGYTAAGCREVLVQWRYAENSRSYNKLQAARNRWRIYRKNLGIPVWKSVFYLSCYTRAGLRKYVRKQENEN